MVTRKICNRLYNKMRSNPLLVFCMFGIFGVLVDADHLIKTEIDRPLHIPIFILVWSLYLCYCAYMHRFLHIMGIGDKK